MPDILEKPKSFLFIKLLWELRFPDTLLLVCHVNTGHHSRWNFFVISQLLNSLPQCILFSLAPASTTAFPSLPKSTHLLLGNPISYTWTVLDFQHHKVFPRSPCLNWNPDFPKGNCLPCHPLHISSYSSMSDVPWGQEISLTASSINNDAFRPLFLHPLFL